MKSRALISIAMTLCASLVSFPLAAQRGNNVSSAPREYTLQVLPGPPGLGGAANANSINDQGWVTGVSNPPDDTYDHAVLWRDGQPTNLGTLGGYNSSGPINNRNDTGWVVGTSETSEPDPYQENFGGFGVGCSPQMNPPCAPVNQISKGYLWQSKTKQMIALPPLPGGNNSFGSGANSQEMFGVAENGVKDPECKKPKGSTQVFRFEGVVWSLGSDGKPFVSRQLSPIADDTVSGGLGINEGGDIVGGSGRCGPPGAALAKHAVLWREDGSVIDLGNLGGTINNIGAAINNLGQVVGNSGLPGDLGPHAFLWEEGSGMQDLGALPGDDQSGATAINDSGEVVGLSCNSATGNCRSFHWQGGIMTDISALPAVSRLLGVTANDINSSGEIPIAANDPTVIDPNTGGPLQIAAVLIPVPTGSTPLALMIPGLGPAAAQLGFNAVPTDSLPSHVRTLLQQRMKLGPFGLTPAVIPSHSTRPNADALVSALAGAKPSTSIAAPQNCGIIGAFCGAGRACCAGEMCGRRHTCCNAPFKDSYCTSYLNCCDGLACLNHRCL